MFTASAPADKFPNDNDAKMFSVSAIETQVFTGKSLTSTSVMDGDNAGNKNSFGLGSGSNNLQNSTAAQPPSSTGGSNQGAGTIGHNSLGQKAMGSSASQESELGQR